MRMQVFVSLVFGSIITLIGLELATRFFWSLINRHKQNSKRVLTLEKQFLLISTLFYLSWALTRIIPNLANAVLTVVMALAAVTFLFSKEKFSIMHLSTKEFFLLFATHLTIMALNFNWASNLDGFENMQIRNTLPVDNVLPSEVARYITESNDRANLFGDWRTSDRPPLSTGAIFLLRPLFGSMNYHNRDFIILMSIQFLFLVAVYHLVKKVISQVEIRNIVFVSLIFSTSILINYAHTWPKLLASGYVLVALSTLIPENHVSKSRTHSKMIPIDPNKIILSVLLFTSALLFHGAEIFAVIVYLIAIITSILIPSPLRARIIAFSLAVLYYLPWYLFQKFIVPSNDRLLKYHLAGNQTRSETPFLIVLRDSYQNIDLSSFVTYRLENLQQFLGNDIGDFFRSAFPSVSQDQSFSTLGTVILHTFSGLTLPVIFLVLFASTQLRRVTFFWKRILVIVLFSYLIWIFVMFDPGSTIATVGPTSSFILVKLFLLICIFASIGNRTFLIIPIFIYLMTVNVSPLFFRMGLREELSPFPLAIISSLIGSILISVYVSSSVIKSGTK